MTSSRSLAYTRETRQLDQVPEHHLSDGTSFPQILVGSSTLPDSRARVHMMVGRGVMKEPGDCLVVMEAIFRNTLT